MFWPTVFDVAAKKSRVEEITALQSKPDFWNNREQAAALAQELALSEKDFTFIDSNKQALLEASEFVDMMLKSEPDEQTSQILSNDIKTIEKAITEQEHLLKFSGPYDSGNAIVTIQSGAGGADAQDWASMLGRMYIRFAERKNWNIALMDRLSFVVQGPYAYGVLKGEHGVHRLVRLSPFNADMKRQTSFARVEILPQLKAAQLPEIDQKDLQIDTFRASGAGGQHVNKTSSAVRIHHIPTGIMVASQAQRSQLQNKEAALSLLASKLQTLVEQQHVQRISDLRGEFREADFGSQIRSYVLHPYTLVKDHRTNVETRNVQDVLDGNLDLFVVHS